MSEPSAIWSSKLIVFDKEISLTQNVILCQGRDALLALIRKIDFLHELTVRKSNNANVYTDPDIAPTLSEICFHQGVASTILFDDSPRRDRENSRTYKLRSERIAYVKKWAANIPIRVLNNRKIRNSLTHIDEHLARALTRPKTGWFIDVAISRRDEYSAKEHDIEIAFCRAYISSDNVILHLDHEISLTIVYQEALALLANVFGAEPPRRDPLASVAPLTSQP